MKVAFVLHLYQPPTQEESVLRQVATECYLPLLKFIKNQKNSKFTLNVPLSLLELMDKYEYKYWLNDLKDLVSAEKVELLGCAAYHALLSKLPRSYAEQEIILNEYGMGYYLGALQGFEGEPSIMLKNVTGFFPPELAVNMDVLDVVSSMGYNWMLVDETAIPEGKRNKNGTGDIYNVKDSATKVVSRDRNLSNMLSFKRDLDVSDIKEYIVKNKDIVSHAVVALDAEMFGHHYKEGLFLLDSVMEVLRQEGVSVVSGSELVDDFEGESLDEIVESTWGASDAEMHSGIPYPYWSTPSNTTQTALWDLESFITKEFDASTVMPSDETYSNLPIWNFAELSKIPDINLRNALMQDILILKFLHSDKYWWCSKHELPLGSFLFHRGMVESALNYVTDITKLMTKKESIHSISSKVTEIQHLLLN